MIPNLNIEALTALVTERAKQYASGFPELTEEQQRKVATDYANGFIAAYNYCVDNDE